MMFRDTPGVCVECTTIRCPLTRTSWVGRMENGISCSMHDIGGA